jgi:heme exporter protein A
MALITSLAVESLAIRRGERALFGELSFTVGAGEVVALTGANGAGKTSLLRAVAGFIAPSAGGVRFDGAGGQVDADEARRDHCHLIGHRDGVAGARTARDEINFAVRWTGGDEEGALAAADRLGLTRMLNLAARQLSAGQRRRLALVRLIAVARTVWLLDEPLTPLDGEGRALVANVMSGHLAGGGIILVAVHDPLPMTARCVAVGP